MSEDDQKLDQQDLADELLDGVSEDSEQAPENTEESLSAEDGAEQSEVSAEPEDPSGEDTAEVDEIQAEPMSDEDCAPLSLVERMEKRAQDLHDLLDEKHRKMLSYVDQTGIRIDYYKVWTSEANKYFKLRVIVEKRLQQVRESG